MRQHGEKRVREDGISSFLRRIPEEQRLLPGDIAALRALARHARTFPDKHVLTYYGEPRPDPVLLLDGVAARVRITRNGNRRILGFMLAGELSIARTGASHANHELVTHGPCIAVKLPRGELARLERRHDGIRRVLQWHAQEEIHAMEDRFVAMNGASVEERLIYLLEDIYARLHEVKQAEARMMSLPLKQQDFADAVGASLVQVSKTLGKLRREGRLDLQYAPERTVYSLPERSDERL